MKKDIKDYLHLYLGCEVEVRKKDRDKKWLRGFISEISRGSNHGDWVEVNFKEIVTVLNQEWEERSSNFHNYFIGYDEIKPILRPLSDMTEEEKKWLNEHEKLKDEFIGLSTEVYFLIEWQAEKIRYLLCKGFDLFNLIPEGLALDKTRL